MPIITIGAACGGLYYTVNAILMGESGILYKCYLEGFKRSFKRGTVLFLITLAVIAAVAADLILASAVVGIMGLLCVGVIAGSMIIALGVMAHLPMTVSANPDRGVLAHLREGMVLAVRNSWRTLVAVVLNVLPGGLFLLAPGLFVESWMFWFLIGFAALAYVNNWLLLKGVDPERWEKMKPVKKEKT
jgi:uncharacterized membrane protein YesL